MRAFVEAHLKERPYDATTDDYDVPAFDKPIETTKATAIYNMHTYWSKKPHDAIRQYIRHYTKPGDLVLDPFCGSGGTALAALMEGRKAIAIDRSPAATFITKNYCTLVDPDALQAAFKDLKGKVKSEIDWLYETWCDRCGGKATTYATVYSAIFQCKRCLSDVPLFHADEKKTDYNKVVYYCPYCRDRRIDEEISLRSKRLGSIPLVINYICQTPGCTEGSSERIIPFPREERDFPDLLHLKEIEKRIIKGDIPTVPMMFVKSGRWGLLQRPYHGDIRTVADFYSPRNLRAVAHIFSVIRNDFIGELRDALLFAVEAISMNMSKLQGYSENPRFPNNMMKGTLYTPPIWREYNVLSWLGGKIRNLVAGYKAIQNENISSNSIMISTQSVCDMAQIPNSSADYIFTDPPYSYKIQFGELNFIWEAWLGLSSDWKQEEIIVNDVRAQDELDWAAKMKLAMSECYRVLKPGRTISLCYHDSSEGSWTALQDVMAECGFITEGGDSAVYIDTDRKSWKQLVADKVTKRDLVINFRKPKPGEWRIAQLYIPADADVQTCHDLARQIIREYLQDHPGISKDRIYDELVSRMVRAGQMESHNFEEILCEVAEEVREPRRKNLFENEDPDLFGSHIVGRWYLKEFEETALDEAESALEDAASQVLAAFIKERLEKEPWREGIHFSDLFECYIYNVKDKPRRRFGDWLLDYFYETSEGTYRLPLDETEAKAKAEARASGVLRRMKRFLTYLANGSIVPDRERPNAATLADWIRHCKRTGLYEQGKLLYEQGGLNLDYLSEEIAVDVEEDYQVCVRTLTRSGGDQPKKKKTRTKA